MANTLNHFPDVGKHVLDAKNQLTFLISVFDRKSTKKQNPIKCVKTWTNNSHFSTGDQVYKVLNKIEDTVLFVLLGVRE